MKSQVLSGLTFVLVGFIVGPGTWIPTQVARVHRVDGRQGQAQANPQNIETWLTAVHRHQAGQLDDALWQIADWPAKAFDRVLGQLMSGLRAGSAAPLFGYGVTGSASSRNGLLRRVALFHTDLAVLLRARDGYQLESVAGAALAVDDGRSIGSGVGIVHWPLTRRVLDEIDPDPRGDRDVRAWYRAIAAWLLQWRDYSELDRHLARARELFPDDAVLCLYLGAMHEALAEPRIQLAVAPRRELSRPAFRRTLEGWEAIEAPPPLHTVSTPAGERGRAEDLYHEALQLDPDSAEARVRLGRLLALRGRHLQALQEFERVITLSPPRRLEYYTRLFRGQALQALGRASEAVQELTRAAELYPHARSAHLVLSQVARDAGDSRGAREALAALYRPASLDSAADPWREYHTHHDPQAEDLIQQLRMRWTR